MKWKLTNRDGLADHLVGPAGVVADHLDAEWDVPVVGVLEGLAIVQGLQTLQKQEYCGGSSLSKDTNGSFKVRS